MNTYNKNTGKTITLVENWVEEDALASFAGEARYPVKDDTACTAKRNIWHSEPSTGFATTQRDVHKTDVFAPAQNGQMPTVQRLPRKSELAKAGIHMLAQQQYEAQKAAAQEARKNDIDAARFSGREKPNHTRTFNPTRTSTSGPSTLATPACTLYSEDPQGVVEGCTPIRNDSRPFNRNTSFSKPIEEYTETREHI